MTNLYRFAPDGRYLGFIVQDRPLDAYAGRIDLTLDQPPDAPIDYWAFLQNGNWVLRIDPPRPAPPTRAPAAAREPP